MKLNKKGVNVEDCKTVSKLIGIKIFINEFIAYSELGKIINFRDDLRSKNLFESYRNGSIELPADSQMIWNVKKLTYLFNFAKLNKFN
jgi:nucleoside permease NupC